MSIRHALLALLSEGPKYGLQLRQEFEAGTGEVWPLNVGQVYTTLQRLERDGLVESDDGEATGRRRRYRITDAGEDELTAWLRTPPDTGAPPRDELVIKVLVALAGARRRRAGARAGAPPPPGRADAAATPASRRTRRATTSALALVVDAELFRLDGVIRWLDAADARLGAATRPAERRQPAAPDAAAPDRRSDDDRVLELRAVSKVYGEGAAEVHGARATSTSSSRPASWSR